MKITSKECIDNAANVGKNLATYNKDQKSSLLSTMAAKETFSLKNLFIALLLSLVSYTIVSYLEIVVSPNVDIAVVLITIVVYFIGAFISERKAAKTLVDMLIVLGNSK